MDLQTMLVTTRLWRVPVTTGLGGQGITINNETWDNANEHEVHFGLCVIWFHFYGWYMNDHDMQVLTFCKLRVYRGLIEVMNP